MAEVMEKSGDSLEEAIIIVGAESDFKGIDAEYEYLEKKYGPRKQVWNLVEQTLIHKDNRHYDRLLIEFSYGARKTIYFNITEQFEKEDE